MQLHIVEKMKVTYFHFFDIDHWREKKKISIKWLYKFTIGKADLFQP